MRKRDDTNTNGSAAGDIDPEMLNNLDLLLDYQIVDQISQDDKQLETLEKLEQFSAEEEAK